MDPIIRKDMTGAFREKAIIPAGNCGGQFGQKKSARRPLVVLLDDHQGDHLLLISDPDFYVLLIFQQF